MALSGTINWGPSKNAPLNFPRGRWCIQSSSPTSVALAQNHGWGAGAAPQFDRDVFWCLIFFDEFCWYKCHHMSRWGIPIQLWARTSVQETENRWCLIRWVVAKSEKKNSWKQSGDVNPTIYKVSTILLVMQDFATIQSLICLHYVKLGWRTCEIFQCSA